MNLIRILTQQATKICSTACLSRESDNLRDIFHENGYPEGIVEKVIRSVVHQGDDSVPRVMQNDDRPVVFMRLPWICTVSDRLRHEIEHTIRKACPLLKPVVCFTTRYAFSGIYKDRLPATLSKFSYLSV